MVDRVRKPRDTEELLSLIDRDVTSVPIVEDGKVVEVVRFTRADELRAAAELQARTMERQNARSTENSQLQYLVSALFEMDHDRKLTVASVRRVPAVRRHQEEQGLSDDRMTRLISAVAPAYAKKSPGRPSPWDDPPEIWLKIPEE